MSAALDRALRRSARFKLPKGACDTHCHVFGPGSRFPYKSGKAPAEDVPKAELAAYHKHIGADRVVFVQSIVHGTDNRAMLDAIAADPKSFRGVALADDSFTEKDFEALHAGGIRGVRFHFTSHGAGTTDMDVFHHVVDRIKGLGWHVQIHPEAATIEPLVPVLRRLTIPFVFDHMGRVFAQDGLDQRGFQALLMLVRMEHGWVKVSGSERISLPPYDAAIPFARALFEAAPDRTVWGTDFPHPNSSHVFEDADLIDLIPQIAPDETSQRRLLIDNPSRLYGF